MIHTQQTDVLNVLFHLETLDVKLMFGHQNTCHMMDETGTSISCSKLTI